MNTLDITLNGQPLQLPAGASLLDAAQLALDALEAEDGGATASLAQARNALQGQEHLEPEFRALAEIIASSLAQAEDAAHTLPPRRRPVVRSPPWQPDPRPPGPIRTRTRASPRTSTLSTSA